MTGILCSLSMIGAPTASAPVGGLSTSLNRSSVSGSATTSTITTNSVTATGSGGNSPYTYAWERVSGNSAISATSSNSRTTAFTRTSCAAGTSYAATWRCVVTDDDGTIAYTSNVSITITCTASSGGGGGGGTSGGTFLGIDPETVSAAGSAPQTATYSINSNGTYTGGSWNSDTTVGASYEVKATTSDTGLSGTFSTWLALSSNRSWSVTASTSGLSKSVSFTLIIRQVGTTTTLDSATISLNADT